MLDNILMALFIEDLERKPEVVAEYDFQCYSCNATIYEGDKFYFLGYKKRICEDCIKTTIRILREYETNKVTQTRKVQQEQVNQKG